MTDNKCFEAYLDAASKNETLYYRKNSVLSECCTFRIGGPADYIIYPKTSDELKNLISELKKNEIYFNIFGNGSNVLFDDSGFRGAAVFTSKINNVDINGERVKADCGVPITQLSSMAQKHGLSGLEFAYGIPGSCGGAVYMNAGAYNGEIKNVLLSSEYFDLITGEVGRLEGDEHCFGYRHSIYMQKDWIVLSAEFGLKYADAESIRTIMTDFMHRRVDKQPLEYPNAGSVFKRAPGHFTGKLIQDAGLKGYTVGGAQVSEKHAGFIINVGRATSSDVRRLIDIIKEKVFAEFGVEIECEVKYIPPIRQ